MSGIFRFIVSPMAAHSSGCGSLVIEPPNHGENLIAGFSVFDAANPHFSQD